MMYIFIQEEGPGSPKTQKTPSTISASTMCRIIAGCALIRAWEPENGFN